MLDSGGGAALRQIVATAKALLGDQYAIEEKWLADWLDPSIRDDPCKGTSRPQLRH